MGYLFKVLETAMGSVANNNFVLRQTEESPYSYYKASTMQWERLTSIVADSMHKKDTNPSYRDGVLEVNVDPMDFYSGVIDLKDTKELVVSMEARRPEEDIFQTFRARGKKAKANYVKVVIYSKEVLAEGKENSTEADWEIISINASPFKSEPMHPVAMMRNQLELVGGTKAFYSPMDWGISIVHWQNYKMCASPELEDGQHIVSVESYKESEAYTELREMAENYTRYKSDYFANMILWSVQEAVI